MIPVLGLRDKPAGKAGETVKVSPLPEMLGDIDVSFPVIKRPEEQG
jgi:hypothetical protein